MMPGMDGYATALAMKALARTRNVPIIFVTSLSDRMARVRALEAGAEEFVSKPVDRAELLLRVRNMLRLKQYQDYLSSSAVRLETLVEERTRDLRASYIETIVTLTRAAEYKDQETGDHVQRVSHYTRLLAETLGMDSAYCEQIFHASPMHDVGKIAIPDRVLLKPGGFTPEEWAVMKTHATLGAEILRTGRSPYLQMGADIAHSHHERWDGTGYPRGLAGETIPLCARIMQICDVYDALRSVRPYKEAFDHASSVAIITQGDDRTMPGHFDPAVLNAFARCSGQFREVFEWDMALAAKAAT
jgi:cyclic di-GMP phosphodiesterase